MGHPMRLELTLAGLLVKLANHYTTRGAHRQRIITSSEMHFLICDVMSGHRSNYHKRECKLLLAI